MGESTNISTQRFGNWQFNSATGDLSDGETRQRLEPQVAKLLEYFLNNQHQVLSRDTLIDDVWDGRVVSDDAINRCVRILRQTFSPDDQNAYIETVSRKGYLAHFPDPESKGFRLVQWQRFIFRRHSLVLAICVAILAVLFYAAIGTPVREPQRIEEAQQAGEFPSEGPPMVAVLPFTATSIEGDSEFFAIGIHDDLLTQLARLQSLRVISRTSVLGYRDTVRNIREIAEELGADAVLEGGVQSVGDRIRINAQLIDARTDEHLWARTYDRELTAANIFEVQSEISRAISSAMHSTLTPQDVNQLAIIPTQNMAAYREYRRALEIRHAQSVWKNQDYRQALERAIELDPLFTRAMAELVGHLSFANFFHVEDSGSTPRAENILERIRALAPDSADHLIAKYYYTYYTLKDFPKAYELIKQAETLSPSDIHLLEIKTYIQRRLGDFSARIETLKKLGELDPLNPLHSERAVASLMRTHQYDAAETASDAAEFEVYKLALSRSLLRLRRHRDVSRWAEDIEAVQRKYISSADPMVLWQVRIANRDFTGAQQLLPSLGTQESETGVFQSDQARAQIITWWFLGYGDRLSELLTAARTFLEQSRDSAGNFINFATNSELALIEVAEGNPEAAQSLVRRALYEARHDMTAQMVMLDQACKILGMAGATTAAVDCLRRAFSGPSLAAPFLEPGLPYYDSIRNDDEFIELLAELE